MTDNEIIKALECCTNDTNEPNCKECTKRPHIYCICELLEEAFDLIKRQQERFDRIVEQLEERAEDCRKYWDEFGDEDEISIMIGYKRAIEIVKGGAE